MLKQKFIVNYGVSLLNSLLGMVAGVFVARYAGPEIVGTLATALATVNIFGFVKGLWGTSHIKLISEGKDEGDCIATYTILQTGSIFLFLIMVASYLLIRQYFLGLPFESSTLEIVTWITLFAVFFEGFNMINDPTFMGKMQISKGNIIMVIRQIVYHVGRIIIVVLGFKAIPLAFMYLVAVLFVLPFTYKLFRSLPLGKWNTTIFKRHLTIVVPIFFIVLINVLIGASDKLLLQHYTNTTQVGYYSAAYHIGGLIIMIGSSTAAIFFPMFSSAIARNDWDYINNKINKYLSFCFVFILPVTGFLVLSGNPLLIWLLGTRYSPSIAPFNFLIFASFMLIIGMPFQNTISGAGKFNLIVLLQFLKFCFYIVSLYLLINPEYWGLGAVGLGINLLLVNTFQNIISYFVSKKYVPLKIDKSILFITLINGLLFILYYFSCGYLRIHYGDMLMFVFNLSYLILVFGILWFTKLVNKGDMESLASIINISKTWQYFKSELKRK
jgi:O-antigen/teichoic acid export membrane protein